MLALILLVRARPVPAWTLPDSLRALDEGSPVTDLNMLPQMVFGNMNFTQQYRVYEGGWVSTREGLRQFGVLQGQTGDLYLIAESASVGRVYCLLLDPRYIDEQYVLAELQGLVLAEQRIEQPVLITDMAHRRFTEQPLIRCPGSAWVA